MTKTDLLRAIKPYHTQKAIFNAIFVEINKALVRRETVKISCFGTFYVTKSNVRFGQSFKTKERISLVPQYKIKFHPSKVINKIVNERNIIGD